MIHVNSHIDMETTIRGSVYPLTTEPGAVRRLKIGGVSIYLPSDAVEAAAVVDSIETALDLILLDPIAFEYQSRPEYWAEQCAGQGMSDVHIAIGEYLGSVS